MLIEDVKRIVHELDQGQQLSSIGVELIDNELAILYMNSKKSEVRLEPTLRLHKGKRYQPQGDRKAKVVGCRIAPVLLPVQKISHQASSSSGWEPHRLNWSQEK